VKVRVGLDQKDPRIVPDMGVRVAFLGQKSSPARPRPRACCCRRRRSSSAGRQERGLRGRERQGGRAPVVPAAQDVGAMKLVPDGVQAGERVVVSPPPALQDGASVAIEEGR
jgi:hypothetical protein